MRVFMFCQFIWRLRQKPKTNNWLYPYFFITSCCLFHLLLLPSVCLSHFVWLFIVRFFFLVCLRERAFIIYIQLLLLILLLLSLFPCGNCSLALLTDLSLFATTTSSSFSFPSSPPLNLPILPCLSNLSRAVDARRIRFSGFKCLSYFTK